MQDAFHRLLLSKCIGIPDSFSNCIEIKGLVLDNSVH